MIMKMKSERAGSIVVFLIFLGMSCARTKPLRALPGLSAGDPCWVANDLRKMTLEETAGPGLEMKK
jgi:hypothetical protein